MTDDTEQLPEGITLIIDQPPNGAVIDVSQTTISGRGLIGNESVRITLTGNFTPLTFTTHARLGVWVSGALRCRITCLLALSA